MAQFTVYENKGKNSKTYPYFIDIQNDLFDSLNSRLVIPLVSTSQLKNTNPEKLCPVIEIKNKKYILLTHQMSSVPTQLLNSPLGCLNEYRNEIINALDFLVMGI